MSRLTTLIMLFLLLVFEVALADKEWVHQYKVKQAYWLLESQLGTEILEFKNHIGLNHSGPGDDEHPNSTGLVAVGAWREDMEDPIWFYGGWFNGWTASSLHFWNGDRGDDAKTPIPGSVDAFNAYFKAKIYLFGGHRIFFANKSFAVDYGQVILGRFYSYNSLVEFYRTGRCYYEGYVDLAGYPHFQPPEETYMEINTARNYASVVLGRVAHLLQDMSVPAHVHDDLHPCDAPAGDGDLYELFMGGNYGSPCNTPHTTFPAQAFNASTALSQGGMLDISSMTSSQVIRYLFYTQNQLSDHFPSDDVPGNNNLPNGSNSYLLARYQALGPPPGSVDVMAIGNELINFSIRATATLFYWFCVEVDLINPVLTPVTPIATSATNLTSTSSTANWQAVSGATSYRLDVATNSGFTSFVNGYNNLYVEKVLSKSITGLSPNTQYWYRVRAANPIQQSPSSNTINVITYALPSVTMSGPTAIEHPQKPNINQYTWTANVVGGSPPYTYVWKKNGYTVGSNSSTYTEYLSYNGNSCDFDQWTLRVDVTGGGSVFATKNVTEYNSCEEGGGGPIDPRIVDAPHEIPEAFGLLQNYPNPFNPETEITFALPELSIVRLTVIDILGREVAVLKDGHTPAGYRSVRWNGRSTTGEPVSSGMYFYRLTAVGESGKSFVETRKMLMTK